MNKRRLRNAGSRPKAFLGMGESAAILAAAGIGAAATYGAAAIGAKASKDLADSSARNITQNTKHQIQAIKDQSAKFKEQQEEAQEFIKEQNAENREIQKDTQMIVQMAMGQNNVNDRLEASKIKVKAGGKTTRLGYPQSLLRGGNMPFTVTDGGGVIPVGLTPEGFELYEIVGDDHEHYHKTRGGKYKSGVGIKFADGNVVEGEGDQRSKARNGGELMLVTPNNAFFISKHNIAGFNPAKMVEQGIHPLEAFKLQEKAKAIVGIKDDGTKAKYGRKGCKFMIGGTPTIYDMANWTGPQLGMDNVSDGSLDVAAIEKNKRSLKCGGKVRHKAYWGTDAQGRSIWISGTGSGSATSSGPGNGARTNYYGQNINNISASTPKSVQIPTESRIVGNAATNLGTPNIPKQPVTNNNSTRAAATGFGNWVNRNADLLGSFANAGSNFLGALVTDSANRDAAQIVANAQQKGAADMAKAYRSLPVIDLSMINKEDYRAAHMMPAFQAPVSFVATNITGIDRKLQRRLRNAARYSSSGAAVHDRSANAEVEAQDEKNRAYNIDQQQMQEIRQKNVVSANEAAKINAMLDTEANKQYAGDWLRMNEIKYNQIYNKILGAAGATVEGNINAANAIAQGRTSGAQAWATALANSGLTFSNTLSTMAKRRADFENTMLGATTDAQINMIARNGSRSEKLARLNAVRSAINSGKLSAEDEAKYRYYETLLERSV